MKFGIIGCGNMGAVILNAAINNKVFKASDVFVAEKSKTITGKLIAKYKKINIADGGIVAKKSDYLLIAVKPQDLGQLLTEISGYIDIRKTVVISVCAGVKVDFIKKFLGKGVKVVRVMPNLPALINNGASAVCLPRNITSAQMCRVLNIFEGCGEVFKVREKDMDAVTAVSGSGPAYFFFFIESLRKTAIEMGLSKSVAKNLAISTAVGASLMAECSKDELASLIARVTSKGGTTEAAFKVFKSAKLDAGFAKGIKAAKRRSEVLSKSLS